MKEEKDFYQISLKIIMKNHEGRVLCLKGVKGGTYENYYDLPGGRINIDEFRTPIVKIIKREVKEEIGNVKYKLNPRPIALGRHLAMGSIVLDGEKREIRVLYLCFAARYLSGRIEISFEHEGYIWLKLNSKNLKKYFRSGNLEALNMYYKKDKLD